MMRDSYCQQVMTFFFLVCNLAIAKLKLQFQSGTPLFKSLEPPLPIYAQGGVVGQYIDRCIMNAD